MANNKSMNMGVANKWHVFLAADWSSASIDLMTSAYGDGGPARAIAFVGGAITVMKNNNARDEETIPEAYGGLSGEIAGIKTGSPATSAIVWW